MYKVKEIFCSIEGEGKRQGRLCNFIRLYGCNLNCTYCDTKKATKGDFNFLSIEEILERLEGSVPLVTLTGGEPLMQENIDKLIKALSKKYEVNIETNGSIDIKGLKAKGVFFSIDYKLPSSGQTNKMLKENFTSLLPEDVLKFVVGRISDIDCIVAFLKQHNTEAQIYITCTKKILYKFVLQRLRVEEALQKAIVSVQLHKKIGVK